MSNRVWLDVNKMTFLDAPLVMYSANGLRELNAQMKQNRALAAGVAIPHYYNKISFITDSGDASGFLEYTGGIITDFSGGSYNSYVGAIGIIGNAYYNPYVETQIDDWIIYYELEPLNKKEWEAGVGLPVYDNVLFFNSGFRYIAASGSSQQLTYTPSKDMGRLGYIIHGKIGVTPTPTHNYDNWLYVKNFKVFNRAKGDSDSRYEIKNTYPCVLWDLQELYTYLSHNDRKPDLDVHSGNFQSVSMLNFKYNGDNNFPLSTWQMSDWGLFNTHRLYTPIGEAVPIVDNKIIHNNTIPNSKLIATLPTQDSKLTVKMNESEYCWYECTDSFGLKAQIVFKTEQDFLNLLADWGLKRVTNDEDEAQNLPAELLPDTGGFVPSGGDSEGYDNNPIIPTIPSFPDNTSDIVDIVTPNISSANAANVYALTLTSTQNFLKWLMTDSFINNISNLFNDKLSALNDLKLLPFDIVNHDTAHTATSNQLTLANVSTDIPCFKVQAGYNCILDGGKYSYTAYWGNYNDYTAATYYLYIPYGGIVELSPSHVVNCELSIKYAVDLMTGNATAVIYSNDVLVKTVPCQMAQPVPITFTNTNQRDIKNALTALSVVNNIGGAITSGATGNIAGAVSGGLGAIGGIFGGIATNPLKIGSIGNFSNSTAFAMPQNAFLIISRAQLSTPSSLASIAGRPSNIYTTINSFVGSGFVQINVSHINTTATTTEQNEILTLLHNGIFI